MINLTNKQFLNIDGVNNIRDVGGILLKNNRIIKRKCILRSASLDKITDEGILKLKSDYNLSHIYDLRSLVEIEELPDKKIENVKFTHLEIVKADMSNLNVPLNSKRFIVPHTPDIIFKNYQEYAVGKDAINCYRKFFNDLIYGNETCVLFHCRSGKDRTGILALLIEYILGANKKDMEEDYLLVNKINKEDIDLYVKKARKITNDPYRLNLVKMCVGTSLELLNQFYLAINNEYGGLDNYILKALDIDDNKRKILIEKYTETRGF